MVRIFKRLKIVLFCLKIRSIVKLFADFIELSSWSMLNFILFKTLSRNLICLFFLSIPFLIDCFVLSSKFLLILINLKIIKNSGLRLELLKNLKHLFTNLWSNFLTVPSLTNRLVLIKRIFQINELRVRNVFDRNPIDWNWARPFVWLSPKIIMSDIFSNCSKHLCNSTEMFWFVNTEHQINICFFLGLNCFIIALIFFYIFFFLSFVRCIYLLQTSIFSDLANFLECGI